VSAEGAMVARVTDTGRTDCAMLRTVSIRLNGEDGAARNVRNVFIVASRLR
jgi:hypothetical protein